MRTYQPHGHPAGVFVTAAAPTPLRREAVKAVALLPERGCQLPERSSCTLLGATKTPLFPPPGPAQCLGSLQPGHWYLVVSRPTLSVKAYPQQQV